jgi:excisionase family DNA binding protein
MTDGCLTLAEVAEKLGVHYMTVYRYVRTGRLPARQVAGEWRVDRADVGKLRQRGAPAPARTAPVGPKRWQVQLEARLIAGDEAGAWALVEAALAGGMGPDESLLDLVAPAMRSVGAHWQSGKWSVADEHRATAVSSRLVARLGSRFARRGVRRGTVVLAAPSGELHSLPVAIGANLLRWKGFNVVELGADTPPDALAEAVTKEVAASDGRGSGTGRNGTGGGARSGLLCVGIVSTVSGASRFVQRSIADVRRSSPDVPVLLGGAAIAGAAQAHRLGADVYTGKRGDELVRAVEALAEERR